MYLYIFFINISMLKSPAGKSTYRKHKRFGCFLNYLPGQTLYSKVLNVHKVFIFDNH